MSDEPTTAVAERAEAPIEPAREAALTPRESREVAVAELLKVSMSKAGMLQLTADESKALMKDFPDEAFRPGAGGKENLIYIEHSHLRDRLNETLGLGQWAIVVREQWTEQANKGICVYIRAMLIVRGCYVAEAVGDMNYYPNNASQNFGDAFEGATTAAFRRCCKQFGIGVQAWNKAWCDAWWARKRGQQSANPAPQSTPTATSPDPVKFVADMLAKEPSIDGLNASLSRLPKMDQPQRLRAWAMIREYAESKDWEWDAEGKSFVNPSQVPV